MRVSDDFSIVCMKRVFLVKVGEVLLLDVFMYVFDSESNIKDLFIGKGLFIVLGRLVGRVK